jgi:hypothetical protein
VSRKYERKTIEEFGAHLLASGDLDPIYTALVNCESMKGDFPATCKLQRWLLAYWCLYHAGAASWLSEREGKTYWTELHQAAWNMQPAPAGGRWPRGHERRHFRGKAACDAVSKMAFKWPDRPEDAVWSIISPFHDTRITPGLPFGLVAARAQELPLFGPWISFKICDMLDRVMGYQVDFTGDDVFMFKDPVKGALMLWRAKQGYDETVKPKNEKAVIAEVVAYLIDHFRSFKAPPRYDRAPNIQEIETILCKWKSHMNGHYPYYNDIHEIREGLLPWTSVSPTAKEFLANMPKGETK